MKTLVIRGAAPLPPALREMIERGSTDLIERSAAELAGAALEADRIVFWSGGDEPELRRAAEHYARREREGGGESVMFVTTGDTAASSIGRFAPDEVFVWPRDEDRLTLAFLTSA
jgi:hypothetical protein